MIKPHYARCHTGNHLNSCSVPELNGLYGGVDDCLLAVMQCVVTFPYPFVIFSDASSREPGKTKGQDLAAFVTKMGFGKIIETPVCYGTHATLIQVWVWDFEGKHKAFLKYMDSRMPELEKAYK